MFKDNMEYGELRSKITAARDASEKAVVLFGIYYFEEHLRSPELLDIMDDYIGETKARLAEIEKLADYLAAREE